MSCVVIASCLVHTVVVDRKYIYSTLILLIWPKFFILSNMNIYIQAYPTRTWYGFVLFTLLKKYREISVLME